MTSTSSCAKKTSARETSMNNSTYVHHYLKPLLDKDKIAVDMTIGNGNDTLFLADLCRYVYAFDIAEQALVNTRKRLGEKDNVKLLLDSHVNVDKYVKDADLFLFNLGYLPHCEQPTVTKASDTKIAVEKAYSLLKENGLLVITFYLGHPGGREEYELVSSYIRNCGYRVIDTYVQEKPESPITYIIRKAP